MLGGVTVTVKLTPALANPPTVTTTFPVVAPAGTVTATLVALQLVAAAVVPLNLTVLVPWVAPKFEPVIVTEAPTNPEVGFKFVMAGVAAPPPVFEGLADWTKPEHPAKVMLATARTQRTTMHKRLFCEFVSERIVIINIFSILEFGRGTQDAAGRVPTHPKATGRDASGKLDMRRERGQVCPTTLHCPQGQAQM